MLAVSAGRRLALLDASSLTAVPPSPSKQTALDVEFTAIAWAHTHNSPSPLIVAAGNTIRQYGSTGHFERVLLNDVTALHPVSAIAVRSIDEVLFARSNAVLALDCTTGIPEHRHQIQDGASVAGLALSSNSNLLAVTAPSSCTVLDLSAPHSSPYTMYGFSSSPPNCTQAPAIVFHPTIPSCLLLASGRHLFLYHLGSISADAGPVGPSKQIVLAAGTTIGEPPIAVACSPFSAGLVVVAHENGAVCLVDLEKEKGNVKFINLKIALSSAAFSADGSCVLVGTTSGHLLVLDLRNLARSPKKISVSSDGKRITGISVQTKAAKVRKLSGTAPKPLSSHDLNVTEPKSLPFRRPQQAPLFATGSMYANNSGTSQVSTSSPNSSSGISRMSTRHQSGTPAKSHQQQRKKLTATVKNAVSPGACKAPLKGNQGTMAHTSSLSGRENIHTKTLPDAPSDRIDCLSSSVARRKAQVVISPNTKRVVAAGHSPPHKLTGLSPSVTTRTRKAPPRSTLTLPKQNAILRSGAIGASTLKTKSTREMNTKRPRTLSCASASTASTTKKLSPSSRLADDEGTISSVESRTPSPEFDAVLPSGTMNMPSLSTRTVIDEIGSRISLRGKGKETEMESSVELDKDNDSHGRSNGAGRTPVQSPGIVFNRDNDVAGISIIDQNPDPGYYDSSEASGLQLDVSPQRRPFVPTINTSADSSAIQFSPFRGLRYSQSHQSQDQSPHKGDGGSNGNAKIEAFLRNVFQDSLYEFRQETRNEIMGLHLDVLKMGRSLRTDMREVLGEYLDEGNMEEGGISEVKKLRDENRRLKEEISRLRRSL